MIPFVFSLSGTELSDEEFKLFEKLQPRGFILFARNLVGGAEQIKKLIDSLKVCVQDLNGERTLFMVDVEGGRVNRLEFIEYFPSARYFGDLMYVKGRESMISEAQKSAHKTAILLSNLGFNCVCSPCADLYHPGVTHPVIGERSFGMDKEIVISLSKVFVEEFKKLGVSAMIKHLPGHGCVGSDSHQELPVVSNKHFSLEFLNDNDFKVFKTLSSSVEYAMVAHIIYPNIDPNFPSSQSKEVISYLRNNLGFKSVELFSDDISMKALKTNNDKSKSELSLRAELCFSAGCDTVLYCSGVLKDMEELANGYEEYKQRLSIKT